MVKYTRKPKKEVKKTFETITEYQPWFDTRVPILAESGKLVFGKTHESCREELTAHLREHVIYPNRDGQAVDILTKDKETVPVKIEVYADPESNELPVMKTEQFVRNFNVTMRAFYLLFFPDGETKAWFKLVPPTEYKTTKGQPIVYLPNRILRDPELISLFYGLWRNCYIIDNTIYGDELEETASDKDLAEIQRGDVEVAKRVATKLARFMSRVWDDDYSPINRRNVGSIIKLIGSSHTTLEKRYSLKKFSKNLIEGEETTDSWSGDKSVDFEIGAYQLGFSDNVQDKFEGDDEDNIMSLKK